MKILQKIKNKLKIPSTDEQIGFLTWTEGESNPLSKLSKLLPKPFGLGPRIHKAMITNHFKKAKELAKNKLLEPRMISFNTASTTYFHYTPYKYGVNRSNVDKNHPAKRFNLPLIPSLLRRGEGWCLVFLFSFFLLPAFAHASTILQAPNGIGLTNGLVGYWTFDGKNMAGVTAYDQSGQGNNGTLTNMSDSLNNGRVIGKLGQALKFDGTDDYVSLATAASLNITADITMSAWVNTSSATAGMHIIDGYGISPFNGYGFALSEISTGKYAYWSKTKNVWVESNSTVNDGSWHFIAVSVTGTTASFYKDGVADGTPATNVPNSYSGVRALGSFQGTSGFFSGSIDDVRIYNRVLTGDEIKRLYNLGGTLHLNKAIQTLTHYTYKRKITIDHTKVPNTDQSNFPVLVSGTYSYLATVANGGKVQNANGYDVIFTSDSGCLTKLNWETETYSATTGAVNYWVKIGTVSHSSNTVFYMCYGNSSISTDQSNKTAVWDSNYKAVWHLQEATGVNNVDSTSNGNTGTPSTNGGSKPAQVSGQIGNALHYISANKSYTDFNPTIGIFDGTQNKSSWEMWVKGDTGGFVNANRGAFVAKYNTHISNIDFFTGPDSTGGVENYWQSSATDYYYHTGGTLGEGAWHHVVFTQDISGAPSFKEYVDGVLQSTTPGSAGTLSTTYSTDSSQDVFFGLYTGSAGTQFFLDASMEEIRVSNSLRSADWISTEYNNQNSPSTFYTVGSETAATSKFTLNTQINNNTLTTGLVGYWDFNNNHMAGVTAYDQSGQGNDGTLTNMATSTNGGRTIGKLGQALSFDGVDDYVTKTSTSFGISGTATISFWVSMSNANTDYVSFVSLGGYVSGGAVFQRPGSGEIPANRLRVAWNGTDFYDSAATFTSTGWHHLVYVVNAGTPTFAYIDGVSSVMSRTFGTGSFSLTDPQTFSIGRREDNTTQYMNGSIDDVRIYNRALTGAEIKRLYNMGR